MGIVMLNTLADCSKCVLQIVESIACSAVFNVRFNCLQVEK